MEPEYVAYQESSHERVSCVECHVGSGADWYVKSKLSGLYQVYAVLTTPIPGQFLLLFIVYVRHRKPVKNAIGLKNSMTVN
jgi:hypothetical protein